MTREDYSSAIKERILEAAATDITFKYSYTVYPNDLEPYYEEGVSKENVIKAFVKGTNLESEANKK